jgi:CBS domain-containing protein
MGDTIREVMTPNPLAVDAQASLVEAAQAMRSNDVGDVLVTEDGRLRGILTDRDIVVRGIAMGGSPTETRTGDCCSPEIKTVPADAPTDRAVQIMRVHALRRLPVVDGNQLVGMVSIGDLAQSEDPQSALADISAAAPNQ